MSEGEAKLVSSSDLLHDFDPLSPTRSPVEETLEAVVAKTSEAGVDVGNVDDVGNAISTPATSTSGIPAAPDGQSDARPTYVSALIAHEVMTTPTVSPPTNAAPMPVTTPTVSPPATAAPLSMTTPTISPPTNAAPLSMTTQEVTPPKPVAMTAIESPLSATTPTTSPTRTVSVGSTPSSRKKKKKHKRASMYGKANHKGHVTPNKSQVTPTATHMTTEQITSDINDIDSFLHSLKVGALHSDPTANASSPTAIKTDSAPACPAVGYSMGMSLIQGLSSGSSSDDSSSDSEESSSESSGEDQRLRVLLEDRCSEDGDDAAKKRNKGSLKYGYPMTRDEVHYRDLPPLESCDVPFPDGGELMEVGVVSHITEELVVIQAYPGTPPVDEGTVLWSQQKKSLSVVFEIFGPVKSPYYSVHVHSPDHALSLGLVPGTVVFILGGDKQLTKYVLTQQLLQQRGSDASWKDDTEVPDNLQEYSDDELEQERKKNKRLGKRCSNTTPTTASPHPQADTPPLPKYTSNPKMSAYFPRATPHARNPPPTFPRALPPRERASWSSPRYPSPLPAYYQAMPPSGPPQQQQLLQQGYPYPPPRGFMGPHPPNIPPLMSPQYAFYPPPPPRMSMPSGPPSQPPYTAAMPYEQQHYHRQYRQ